MIRGTIKIYQLSQIMNFNLIVDIQHHPISQFLKKRDHIFSDFIKENKENIPFIFPGEVEKYITTLHTLDAQWCNTSTNDVVFFFSNDICNTPVDNDCKEFIRELLTPNDDFLLYFTEKIKEIPYNEYNILHYRLGDSELVNCENSNIDNKILQHLQRNFEPNDVLVSDSMIFKKFINDNTKGIFTFNTHIGHIGYHTDYEKLRDTLFEFFVITRAKKIKYYSVYGWTSGFVNIAKQIYDVEIYG